MAKIVIIEDNPENARLAARLLRKAGHDVFLADEGETGLMAVLDHEPDLVLIDLGLPDMDGQTVVALIKQQGHLSSIPILAFTAYPEEKAREMAEAYGCEGVITKPINTRQFAIQVNDYLTGSLDALGKISPV